MPGDFVYRHVQRPYDRTQDVAVAEEDWLYRRLDHIGEHKQELFVYLRKRWQDLFGTQFDSRQLGCRRPAR